MPTFKVKVKWGREMYDDVEVNTDEVPMLFKAQLFTLTGVQPERQKVMIKGATLRDDNWDKIKVKNGLAVLLMGSKEEDVPKEPVEKPVFLEDMSENELVTALELPAGLNNLGNTCYMNATVQCLKTVPELTNALKKHDGSVSLTSLTTTPSESITSALRDLYSSMEKTSPFPPILLLQVLHNAFPRFAEKGEQGGFMQQDANECWVEVVRMLQQRLKVTDNEDEPAGARKSVVDRYFGGILSCTLKCTECEEEPPTNSIEDFLQLSCFISTDVRYLHSGLKSRMEESITKRCPNLDKDVTYKKISELSRLPGYLAVQFMRFFYKEKGSVNAKILKDIKFPLMLDVFSLCSSELQQKLIPMRTKFKELEDKHLEDSRKGDVKKEKPKDTKKKKSMPYSFDDDPGSNNSGYYRLQAVLTHKGRSSSSGHYVAWVRRDEDNWVMCDDENVTPITSEDILKLSGGGDWHIAYVLLYGPRILEIEDEEETEEKMETS